MTSVPHRRLLDHFRRVDPRMAALARDVGPCGLHRLALDSPFRHLFQAILAQQISSAAAATIQRRVVDSLGAATLEQLDPAMVLAAPVETLRAAGLSAAKTRAVRDLAEKTLAGVVPDVATLDALTDDAIVERLTVVRGIGPWTVQMMLMFQLGRADVLPIADYGVRNGFRITYRRRTLPTPGQLACFGARWAPYRSAAAWYLWRAVDRASTSRSQDKARFSKRA